MLDKLIIGNGASHIIPCHKVIVCITSELPQQQHAVHHVSQIVDIARKMCSHQHAYRHRVYDGLYLYQL